VRRAARLAAAALATALSACGGESPSGKPRPAPSPTRLSRTRVEGIDRPSAAAVVEATLLLASSSTSNLLAVPLDEIVDGAVVRGREVPLSVEETRTAFLAGPSGPREIRLGDLWKGPQSISGLAVAAAPRGGGGPVLYALSESYRVVWFGPLLLDERKAPVSCRFERVADVPGAARTHAAESDWHDDPSSGGVAGLALQGEDVVVLDRATAGGRATIRRLDRIAGTLAGATGLSPPADERGAVASWTDVATIATDFVATRVRATEGGASSTRIVRLTGPRRPRSPTPFLPSESGSILLEVDDAVEGLAVSAGFLYAVASDAGGGTVYRRALGGD
jgi:hypothetical protein